MRGGATDVTDDQPFFPDATPGRGRCKLLSSGKGPFPVEWVKSNVRAQPLLQ